MDSHGLVKLIFFHIKLQTLNHHIIYNPYGLPANVFICFCTSLHAMMIRGTIPLICVPQIIVLVVNFLER